MLTNHATWVPHAHKRHTPALPTQTDTPQRFPPKQTHPSTSHPNRTWPRTMPVVHHSCQHPEERDHEANLRGVQTGLQSKTQAHAKEPAPTLIHMPQSQCLAPHKRTGAPWKRTSGCHQGGEKPPKEMLRGESRLRTYIAGPGCAAEQCPHHEDSLRRRQKPRARANTRIRTKQNNGVTVGSQGQELDGVAQQAPHTGSLRASEADCAAACC